MTNSIDEINKAVRAVVQEAIENHWFDEMTTSDLQGACQAEAMQIVGNNSFAMIEVVSDKILEGIYAVEGEDV
jgi:hypothetical protein